MMLRIDYIKMPKDANTLLVNEDGFISAITKFGKVIPIDANISVIDDNGNYRTLDMLMPKRS